MFRWQGGKALSWQTLGLLLAWLLVVGLHLGNDGLWYQGDAPRHAANGLFWWDFLTRLPADPFRQAAGHDVANIPAIARNPAAPKLGFSHG